MRQKKQVINLSKVEMANDDQNRRNVGEFTRMKKFAVVSYGLEDEKRELTLAIERQILDLEYESDCDYGQIDGVERWLQEGAQLLDDSAVQSIGLNIDLEKAQRIDFKKAIDDEN